MRTLKLILIALFASLGASAQNNSQILTSQSDLVVVTKTSTPHHVILYGKAGVALDMFNFKKGSYDWHGDNSQLGYEVDLGLKGNIGQQGAYWGAELGAMSYFRIHWSNHIGNVEKEDNFALQLNPFVGWDFPAGETVTFSPYIGPWLCYGFKEEDFRAGASIGINFWFNKKYAIGINYKRDLTDNRYLQKLFVGGIIKL